MCVGIYNTHKGEILSTIIMLYLDWYMYVYTDKIEDNERKP